MRTGQDPELGECPASGSPAEKGSDQGCAVGPAVHEGRVPELTDFGRLRPGAHRPSKIQDLDRAGLPHILILNRSLTPSAEEAKEGVPFSHTADRAVRHWCIGYRRPSPRHSQGASAGTWRKEANLIQRVTSLRWLPTSR